MWDFVVLHCISLAIVVHYLALMLIYIIMTSNYIIIILILYVQLHNTVFISLQYCMCRASLL